MQFMSCQRTRPPIEASTWTHAGNRPGSGKASVLARHGGWVPRTTALFIGGFTLIELMITLVIAMILIMIAVPSFRSIIMSNRLTTASNDLVGSINIARMEAVKRNASTQLCGSTGNGADILGAACQQAGAVYALVNNQPVPVGAAVTGITSPIVLTGNMLAVRFGGQGIGHSPTDTTPLSNKLIADISTTALSTDNHRCVTLMGGSVIATSKSSTACPNP